MIAALEGSVGEIGIDATDHVPVKLDDDHILWADVIVATCDDSCPVSQAAVRPLAAA